MIEFHKLILMMQQNYFQIFS